MTSAASPSFETSGSVSDIVCLSHLRWDFVTQRPQHLLQRAAAGLPGSPARRVFFWEEPIWDLTPASTGSADTEPTLEILDRGPNLRVLRPHLAPGQDPVAAQQHLLAGLCRQFEINSCVRWFYTPMALPFAGVLPSTVTVYDCMDELSAFLGAPPELLSLESELLHQADIVFTGGLSLFESKRRRHPNVYAFPSSIDVPHFAQAGTGHLSDPADQAGIPHPRAGFYGVIDERLDLALLRDLSTRLPDVHLVLLGPVVKIDPASLPQAPNLHYLGPKSYADLPTYLSGWDVALMPFARNESTRFISPTKTPEYLAAGRPVVSTPIRDVERTWGDPGLVHIAATPDQFAECIRAALHTPSPAWRAAVAEALGTSSWDSTWQSMNDLLTPFEASSLPASSSARKSVSHATLAPPLSVSALRLSSGTADRSKSRTPAPAAPETFDDIVVGAGFAGAVLAERLASELGRRVLVIDKRDHIAGNAYDHLDENGILVHRYGPHIFHTNSTEVVDYLSRFTSWRPYEHRVLASVDGQLLPIPINLDTINQLYGLSLDSAGMEQFLAARAEIPADIRTSEDIVVSRVGRELYEKFFRNYTRKQWGVDPSELSSSVAGRIPVRFNQDDRYFTDTFQSMPRDGYTRMFERILDHPRITVRTGVDFETLRRSTGDARIVYTGPIDEYFGFRFGPLPYRSLEFRHETHDQEQFQAAPVVNYPNDHPYTRVTEFKYLTGQRHRKTSIVYEYPRSTGDPYYPIPRPENAALYARYRDLAARDGNVVFCGRLANYQYFNMDQVVAQALVTFRRLAGELTHTSTALTAAAAATTAAAGASPVLTLAVSPLRT